MNSHPYFPPLSSHHSNITLVFPFEGIFTTHQSSCRKVMFSVMSVRQSFSPWGVSPCDHSIHSIRNDKTLNHGQLLQLKDVFLSDYFEVRPGLFKIILWMYSIISCQMWNEAKQMMLVLNSKKMQFQRMTFICSIFNLSSVTNRSIILCISNGSPFQDSALYSPLYIDQKIDLHLGRESVTESEMTINLHPYLLFVSKQIIYLHRKWTNIIRLTYIVVYSFRSVKVYWKLKESLIIIQFVRTLQTDILYHKKLSCSLFIHEKCHYF